MSRSCPNELKFCEVSRNYKSKICWKFQISILTNKKVLSLKKILSVPYTMESSFFSLQMATWRPNFPHQRLYSVTTPIHRQLNSAYSRKNTTLHIGAWFLSNKTVNQLWLESQACVYYTPILFDKVCMWYSMLGCPQLWRLEEMTIKVK